MENTKVQRYAEAELPTEYGVFRVVVYREEGTPLEHVALVRGDIAGKGGVLARVHSECLTGEVFHSQKCDCREQLDLAFRRVAAEGEGVILYLRQEGRGIGLGNKIKAYALQERGLDTVDANTELGFPSDGRRYHVAARMLADLRVRSIALMTNNPDKVAALEHDGVVVARRMEHAVESNEVNRSYLATKRDRMGHWLEPDAPVPYDAE